MYKRIFVEANQFSEFMKIQKCCQKTGLASANRLLYAEANLHRLYIELVLKLFIDGALIVLAGGPVVPPPGAHVFYCYTQFDRSRATILARCGNK